MKKVVRRTLRRNTAFARASEMEAQATVKAQERRHSSGHARLKYRVERGFGHWKVTEE